VATLAAVENVLIRRLGPAWTEVGLGVTPSSPPTFNADFQEAIATACRLSGIALADPAAVADADLAALSADQFSQVCDLAELRGLETALGHFTDVDEQGGTGKLSNDQFGERLEKRIVRLEAKCERLYGIGRGTIDGGAVDLGFAETCDDSGEFS
jgi:hypothetical protein